MTTGKALDGKPYAGNPHVRFDEGEVAPAATPRRGSLLYERGDRGGHTATILTMVGMFFMIGFVSMLTNPIGGVVKSQFRVSNALSQFGSASHFLAYFFAGVFGGMLLRRRGYKVSSVCAMALGAVGFSIQLASGYAESFALYVLGAFVSGVAAGMMSLVASPMLNTLGGDGSGGNRLIQYALSANSLGGMIAPFVLGAIIGGDVAKARVADAAPVQALAVLIFLVGLAVVSLQKMPEPHLALRGGSSGGDGSFGRDFLALFRHRNFAFGVVAYFVFIPAEMGIPNMANLYLTQEGSPAYAGPAVAAALVTMYCGAMMVGRFAGGMLGRRIPARVMVATGAFLAAVLSAFVAFMPLRHVAVPFLGTVPASMLVMVSLGLFVSVLSGGIFNLSVQGLGRLVPAASGVMKAMVIGGALLSLVGAFGDRYGVLRCYYIFVGIFIYISLYAVFGTVRTRQ